MVLSRDEYVYLVKFRKGPMFLDDLDPVGRKLKSLKLLYCEHLEDFSQNPQKIVSSMAAGRLITPRRLTLTDKGEDALREYEIVVHKNVIAQRWNIVIVVIASLTLVATVIGIFAALGWLS